MIRKHTSRTRRRLPLSSESSIEKARGPRRRPVSISLDASSIILDAARSWRRARDHRTPVQPAMARALLVHDCVILAPVMDSLLRLFEACAKRRFQIGLAGHVRISSDERRLLAALHDSNPVRAMKLAPERPQMIAPMGHALRSVQIILRAVLDGRGHGSEVPLSRPRLGSPLLR